MFLFLFLIVSLCDQISGGGRTTVALLSTIEFSLERETVTSENPAVKY